MRLQMDQTYAKNIAQRRLIEYADPDQPLIKRGRPWSKDEHQLFVELFEKYGKNWSVIAQKIPGKSRQQCRYYGEVCKNKFKLNPNISGAHLAEKLDVAFATIKKRRRYLRSLRIGGDQATTTFCASVGKGELPPLPPQMTAVPQETQQAAKKTASELLSLQFLQSFGFAS